MSNVFFISDLHFGHKSILGFSPDRDGDNISEHDHILIEKYKSVVSKRDTAYFLGDICFELECMKYFDEMPGNKVLILGNHDKFDLGVYQKYFYKIHGFMKYMDYWLSHCPMHPDELRGRKNVHGHVHMNVIMNGYTGKQNENYISVCVEANNGYPIKYEDLEKQ